MPTSIFKLYDPPRHWLIILEGHGEEIEDACTAVIDNQPSRYRSHHTEYLDDDHARATIHLSLVDPIMIRLVQSIFDTDFPDVHVVYNGEHQPERSYP